MTFSKCLIIKFKKAKSDKDNKKNKNTAEPISFPYYFNVTLEKKDKWGKIEKEKLF